MNTILMAIILAPRFLFQIYFRPSKLYDFSNIDKKNKNIYRSSLLFQGLFLGMIMAVPHYLWYNNIVNSILFAVAVAVVFVVVVVSVVKGAAAVAFVPAFAIAWAGAGADEVSAESAFAFVVALAGSISFALTGANTVIIKVTLEFAGKQKKI